ncbi:MAG: DUF1566 domain-containing protein [Deltaproteobacteria bacterium]|nr:DUF1566 domain-containing protein [Deltaproteobacteria bacterium]
MRAMLLTVLALTLCAACNQAEDVTPDAGDASSDGDTDTDADTDADADTDTDGDADSDSDTASDGGLDAGDAGEDAAPDSDTSVACSDDTPCTGLGLICNENWGICAVSSCMGADDFTPCEMVTNPDRSYDICIGGACVSPGCGDTSCNPTEPHFPIPDTGLRLCYDAETEIACPGDPDEGAGCASTAFCGQDAQYGWDAEHSADERFTRDTSVANEPIVTDKVTGLMWQGCARGLIGDSCGTGSAAYGDWASALAYCDGLSWGGHADWRLPDVYELLSIVDEGTYSPSIDTSAFPATPSNWFWSSSSADPSPAPPNGEWGVNFNTGQIEPEAPGNYCRCVRLGAPVPHSRFERTEPVIGEFVVRDLVTGLSWQGCVSGLTGGSCETGVASELTWQQALAYCQNLDWGGRTDWYLPSVKELQSIMDVSREYQAIDPVAFPTSLFDLPSTWSSSTYQVDASFAWYVDIYLGGLDAAFDKGNDFNPARCARRGP